MLIKIEAQVRVAVRDAVNRKSRKPFYWGGLKGYEQLEAVGQALEGVPSDEPETGYLLRLKMRVDRVVEAYRVNAADLKEAHTWLRGIADCLRYPPSDSTPEPSLTGEQVQQEMEALLQSFQPDLKRRPAQAALHGAWHRTWEEYGPDLLPCYDIPGLPPDNLMLESLFGRLRRHQRRVSGRKSTRELRDFGQYQALFLAQSEEALLQQIRQVSPEEYRENRRRLEEAEAPRRLLHRLHRDPHRTMRSLVDQHAARRAALASTAGQLSLKRPECPPVFWGEGWSVQVGEPQLPIQVFRWQCSTACYAGAYYWVTFSQLGAPTSIYGGSGSLICLKSRNLFPEGCKIPNRQTIAPNKSLRGPEEQFRPALHSSERVGNRASVKGQCLARGPEVDRQYERDG